MTPVYATLEIRISKQEIDGGEEYYPVEFTLKTPDDEDKQFLAGRLSPEVLKWRAYRYSPDDGARMFDRLFKDQLRQNWTESRGLYPQYRIRLRFDDHDTIGPLHTVPWELLHDTTVQPSRNLAAQRNTPFSRYVTGTASGQTIKERPLNILVAVASPQNLKEGDELTPVDVMFEEQIIIDALATLASGQVELTFVDQPVTLSKLESYLKKDRYHLLHVVGHGRFLESKNAAYLYLADDNGKTKPVQDQDFAAMFGRQGVQVPQFIFLASCQTAKRPKNDPFQGFAPALIQAGIPAVLAMQEKIHIPTSQAFTRTFYQELFEHGFVDLACNAARSTVLTEALLGSHIPVLFSRLHNNQLLIPQDKAVSQRKDFEPETIYIRSGEFLMGSSENEKGAKDYEKPQSTIDLPAYRIGKYPVTNDQYQVFIQKTGRLVPAEAGWDGQIPPAKTGNHPVSGITWNDAIAYCEWLSEQTGRQYCLPDEAQWEKAARYTDGRIYPWGNEWDSERCNHGDEGTVPVDRYPPQSEYGCYDMIGNVREWVTTRWGSRRHQPDGEFGYPWADDDREDLTGDDYILRVFRGGSVKDKQSQLRCTARGGFAPNKPGPPGKRHGFRVVMKL